jgi:PAS domain S-box-containing protein
LLVTPLIIAICILISFFIARTIERRLAEVNNELRDAEERAQLMLNTSPLAVNFIDEKFNIIDSNKEALNMFGVPDKTKFQSNFFEYSPIYQQNGELSVELGQKYVKRVFDEGYVRFEWEHQRANGEIFSCDVTAFRSKYKNQNYAIVHMRDLSELKAAISQMRQADEYVQLLLDAMPLACSLWDSNINPIACNLEAVKLHKLSSKEEYIEKFFQLSPPMQPDGKLSGEKAIDCIKKTLEEGYLRIEWVHQTIDGELFPCEVTLIRLKHRGEYIVAGYIKDLS